MPRYSLRNQDKIKKAFGDHFLNMILASLFTFFSKGKDPETTIYKNEPYPIIRIPNSNNDGGVFEFYVITKTYDIFNLAFKQIT